MKKNFLLLVFLFTIFISSCSSEKDDYITLDGTLWVNEEEGHKELKFTKSEFFFKYEYKGEKDEDYGTYKYEPPFIHFTAIDRETNKVDTMSGVVKGNALILGVLTFTKQ